MDKLFYNSHGMLPGVILDKETGKFEISGKSCPVDAFEFYDPIFNWLDEYSANPLENTVFDLRLTYFNTVSAKFLLRIMTKLEKLTVSGNEVKIRWFYNEGDEDQVEAGEEFESILDINFEMISIKDQTGDTKADDYFDHMIDDIM